MWWLVETLVPLSSGAATRTGTRKDISIAMTRGKSMLLRVSTTGLFALAVLAALHIGKSFFAPIALAVLFAVILYPLVRLIRRTGCPKTLAAATSVVMALAAIAIAITTLAPPAEVWMNRLPFFVRQIELKLDGLFDSIQAAREMTSQIANMGADDQTDGEPVVVVEQEQPVDLTFVANAPLILFQALMTLILCFFVLAFGPQLIDGLVAAVRDEERRDRVRTALGRVASSVGQYYQTVTIINIGLGLVTAGAMAALGMPEPALWGFMAAVLNFIPYIGPAATTGVIGLISLLSFYGWGQILAPPLIHFALNAIEGQFVTPMVLSHRLTLNPLLVVLSVLFWGWVWGLVGVLLAVPILAAVRVLSEEVEELRRWSTALG